MRRGVDEANARISRLEEVVSDHHADDYLVEEAMHDLPIARSKLRDSRNHLQCLERALGVEDHKTYHHLAQSEYIRLRMNAWAIKMRLRDRLRSRKFELDCVERSLR